MAIKVAVGGRIETISQIIELIRVGQLVPWKPPACQLLAIEKIELLFVTFHVRDVFSYRVNFHLSALITGLSWFPRRVLWRQEAFGSSQRSQHSLPLQRWSENPVQNNPSAGFAQTQRVAILSVSMATSARVADVRAV